MPVNRTRGTPGLLLLAFAVALLCAAAAGWELLRERRSQVAAVPLTGLGDTSHYTRLSPDDLHTPALVFPGAPQGLFRRSLEPVPRPDATMHRSGPESSGRFTVYTDTPPGAAPNGAAPRWFLKAGDNLYVEFGEQKHWPSFEGDKR